MIQIRNLAVRAGHARILRGVSLDIDGGSILGVVGESGSGKSTLAGAIMGLLPAGMNATGRIDWDGTDLLALPPGGMQRLRGTRLAMIFQDPMTALNPLFTIGAHLRDVLRRRHPGLSRGAVRTRSADMLGHVGMSNPLERLDSYPHQLSGGMRQRVVIAMALLVEPGLLIADEPTTALDATVEAQIARLFADMRHGPVGSMLFISHHLGLVSQLCDMVSVMYGGTVVETGPVAAIIGRPLHPYTQGLLACEIGEGGGRLLTIPGEVPDPATNPAGCIFAPRCPRAEAACRTVNPPLALKAPGHRAACILAADA